MNNQEFWQDKGRSEETLREVSAIKSTLEPIQTAQTALEDCGELIELAAESGEESVLDEIAVEMDSVDGDLKGLELTLLFSDPEDKRDAILTVHPGAGGTE